MTEGFKQDGRIFISYRRADALGVAGRLHDTLDEYLGEKRVFRDTSDIRAGADFGQVIEETLDRADGVIVLIGDGWSKGGDGSGGIHDPEDWVAKEVRHAIERGVPIFPVLVEGAPMPRSEELPDDLQALTRFNAVSIRDGTWNEDIDRLAGVIALDLPGSAAERRLRSVSRGVAGLLLLALCFSLGTAIRLELGMLDAAANPNSTQLFFRTGGLQILLVLGAVVLLLVHRKHMAPPSSTHALLAGLVGLVHVAIALVGGHLLEATETLPRMLAGNIFFSAIMLSLMALSGLRPK